ncbi:hypothetical protein ADL04_01365 [Streptomyces sp. NRRL B-3648]|nr:hypothetical protein ADL04_01365 [Streptomyces sp. NRRL B-3648]
MTGEADAADDLAADALPTLWHRWDRVRAAEHPVAYARGVVTNLEITLLRDEFADLHHGTVNPWQVRTSARVRRDPRSGRCRRGPRADELDRAVAATPAGRSMRRFAGLLIEAEMRDLAEHPDPAGPNVQLNGFHGDGRPAPTRRPPDRPSRTLPRLRAAEHGGPALSCPDGVLPPSLPAQRPMRPRKPSTPSPSIANSASRVPMTM